MYTHMNSYICSHICTYTQVYIQRYVAWAGKVLKNVQIQAQTLEAVEVWEGEGVDARGL